MSVSIVQDFMSGEKIRLWDYDYVRYSVVVYDTDRVINPMPLKECYIQPGNAQRMIDIWNANPVNKMKGQKYFYRLESVNQDRPNPIDLRFFSLSRNQSYKTVEIVNFERIKK